MCVIRVQGCYQGAKLGIPYSCCCPRGTRLPQDRSASSAPLLYSDVQYDRRGLFHRGRILLPSNEQVAAMSERSGISDPAKQLVSRRLGWFLFSKRLGIFFLHCLSKALDEDTSTRMGSRRCLDFTPDWQPSYPQLACYRFPLSFAMAPVGEVLSPSSTEVKDTMSNGDSTWLTWRTDGEWGEGNTH